MAMQTERHLIDGKLYITDKLNRLNFERDTQKYVESRAEKLPPGKKEVFRTITGALRKAIIWQRFNSHVIEALTSADPQKLRGNYYDLKKEIKRVVSGTENWVRRRATFPEDEVKAYAGNLLRSSRSICRVFDRNATCWQDGAEELVVRECQRI